MYKKLFVLFLFVFGAVGIAFSAEALEFPASGKIGLYDIVGGGEQYPYRTMIYRAKEDDSFHVVVWQNSADCRQVPGRGACVAYRGNGGLLQDGSLEFSLFYSGSTVEPEGKAVGTYTIRPDGVLTSDWGGTPYYIDNYRLDGGKPFFGNDSLDGVYLTEQWACFRGPDAPWEECDTLRLDENLPISYGQMGVSWRLEVFTMTDERRVTHTILPWVGPWQVVFEWATFSRGPGGVRHPILCGTLSPIFGDLPGCAAAEFRSDTGFWWAVVTGGPSSLISGQAVPILGMDSRAAREAEKRGPVAYNPLFLPREPIE